MSVPTPQTGGQAPSDPQSPGGTPAQTAPQAGDGEQSKPTAKTLEEALATIEKLQRELQKTNQEAASHRVENKTLKQQQEEAERAKLSELEKAQKDAAKHQQTALELQQKYQDIAVRMAIKDKAVDLGFQNPDDAVLMLRASGDLDYDDDGQPKNAEKLLKALAESKPYLLKAAAPSQPQAGVLPANPSRSGQTQSNLSGFDARHPPSWRDVPPPKRPT